MKRLIVVLTGLFIAVASFGADFGASKVEAMEPAALDIENMEQSSAMAPNPQPMEPAAVMAPASKKTDDKVTTLFKAYKDKDSKFLAQNLIGVMKVAKLQMSKEEREAIKNITDYWVVMWEQCAEATQTAFVKDLKALMAGRQTFDFNKDGTKCTIYYNEAEGDMVKDPLFFIHDNGFTDKFSSMVMYFQGTISLDAAQDLSGGL